MSERASASGLSRPFTWQISDVNVKYGQDDRPVGENGVWS